MTIKKTEFFKVQNITFFSKGLTHAFGQKMPFFLYIYWIKVRLEIMLSNFEEKKIFDYKKAEFFKVQKIAFFLKGLTHAFGQKMPIIRFI